MKDTLCIIPARSGSKGIKDKNILKLNNKELIIHSIKFAKKLKFVKHIILSTDSQNYLDISKKFLKTKNKLRPKNISTDKTKMIDVINYEIKNYEGDLKYIKKVLLLQPTCPFRKIQTFIKANRILSFGDNYDSIITLNEVKDHPERMKIINKKNIVKNYLKKNVSFQRRQDLKKVYIRSGSMYFFKLKNIYKKKDILGKKTYGIIIKGKEAINIDTIEDMILAQYYSKI